MRAHKVEAAGLKRGALRAALEGTRKGKVKCTSYRLHPSMCFAYFLFACIWYKLKKEEKEHIHDHTRHSHVCTNVRSYANTGLIPYWVYRTSQGSRWWFKRRRHWKRHKCLSRLTPFKRQIRQECGRDDRQLQVRDVLATHDSWFLKVIYVNDHKVAWQPLWSFILCHHCLAIHLRTCMLRCLGHTHIHTYTYIHTYLPIFAQWMWGQWRQGKPAATAVWAWTTNVA